MAYYDPNSAQGKQQAAQMAMGMPTDRMAGGGQGQQPQGMPGASHVWSDGGNVYSSRDLVTNTNSPGQQPTSGMGNWNSFGGGGQGKQQGQQQQPSWGMGNYGNYTGGQTGTPYQGQKPSYAADNYGGISKGQYSPSPMSPWNPQVPSYGGGQGQMPTPMNNYGGPYTPGNFNTMPNTNGKDNPFGEMSQGQGQGQQPFGGFGFTMPGNFNEETWRDKNMRDYLMNMQPFMQMFQNANQWNQEFGEGNQRYWDESGWGKQRDIFGMGLSGRQQEMAEWQANEAAKQWQAQFGREGVRDEREWDLANRQFGFSQEMGRADVGIQQEKNRIDEMFKSGQLSNEQYSNATARLKTQNDKMLGDEANRIDEMFKSGQLSNAQRELALAELTQRQKYGLEERGMSLQERTQDELTDYRNRQLEAQNQQAAMAAFGRAQAPTAKWMRSW